MFDDIYKIVQEATSLEDLKKKLKHICLEKQRRVLLAVAAQLARDGKKDRVKWLRKINTRVGTTARGYVVVGNHERVEAHRNQHSVSVKAIVCGYALTGNHKRVEAYRNNHGAGVDNIASGYKLAGNHDKQKKYSANFLFDNGIKEKKSIRSISEAIKESSHRSFLSFFQKNMTQKIGVENAFKQVALRNKVAVDEHVSTLKNSQRS